MYATSPIDKNSVEIVLVVADDGSPHLPGSDSNPSQCIWNVIKVILYLCFMHIQLEARIKFRKQKSFVRLFGKIKLYPHIYNYNYSGVNALKLFSNF